jgi:hypothetical protein
MRRLRRALTAVVQGAAWGAAMGDPRVAYLSRTRTAARGRSGPEETGVTSERAARLTLISTWHDVTLNEPVLVQAGEQIRLKGDFLMVRRTTGDIEAHAGATDRSAGDR